MILYTGDKDPNYFVKKVEECHHARELSNHAEKKIVNLRREITGYDEREIMQMMYPDEDVDSEDSPLSPLSLLLNSKVCCHGVDPKLSSIHIPNFTASED